MSAKKPSLYLISVLLFMLILPLAFIVYQCQVSEINLGWMLIGKWFLFWSVGVRLFIAGLRQATKPAFTAKEIFHFTTNESYPLIIELGFANISVGLVGILSLVRPEWCAPIAVTGGLYFGLAGLMHIVKKPVSRNEVIAMVSDLYIFVIMALYLCFTL